MMIKSRRMIWVGHAFRMREMRNSYKILVRKREEKRPLGRPRRRWENNIRMGLKEIEWEGMAVCMWLRTGISAGFL
jgi:hypothetical protein